MNIFILDADYKKSATKLRDLDKVRFNKQIVELVQVLAQVVDFELPKADGSSYKRNKSILGHPATKWATNNQEWCVSYLGALLAVYEFETGKTHACSAAYEVLSRYTRLPTSVPDFGWFSYKVKYTDLANSVIEATGVYLMAKQIGMYSN